MDSGDKDFLRLVGVVDALISMLPWCVIARYTLAGVQTSRSILVCERR